MNLKKPIAALSAGVLLSGILFSTSVDASQAKKKLDAHYNDIKIVNNNQNVAIDPATEPFIVNGSTYIPLRMMGEVFNKNIQWDSATQTIRVTDKTPPISPGTVASLEAQVRAKDAQILKLQSELDKLKKTQKEEDEEFDIDDLEDQLNDDYGDYDDLDDIEIFLAGDEDELDIRIDVDDRDWKDFYDREKKEFIEDIVDDILDEVDDVEIEGAIRDADNSDKLATFEVDSDGDLEIDLKSKGTDLDDLEDDLNDDYGDYRYIDDVEISLSGDEDDIDIDIEVDASDWEDLDEEEKLDFLQDIVDDILDEFDEAFIDGRILDSDDGDRLDTFYADGDDDDDVTID